ncbi:fimbrial protein [Citrobacter sp. HN-141]|uniref:fimbrial protein n=1 Tax=unclassified Citrobacter TaxID=2644389 RepID=UPI002963D4B2|nr:MULTISPECIES: fimbrial protein [unclassified Citrobacter]MDW2643202.1 fimbrial protein [Citrobacter sp. HN-141]MDW2652549.1 fimbrial protein [Citrobacter sp. HN-120]MDW2695574.1 fimbrial protein [Citrobacter sp. HN-144]
MKIIKAVLFPALYLILIVPAPAAEFTVTGMINKTTCAINDDNNGEIVLPDIQVGRMRTSTGDIASTEHITVSCDDPAAFTTVEGRFTTNGAVDPATLALKNLITDASGAKDVGVQIIDPASHTVITPNAQESSVTLTLNQGQATFDFGFAYVNLGAAEVGDVRVETTFIATYQ